MDGVSQSLHPLIRDQEAHCYSSKNNPTQTTQPIKERKVEFSTLHSSSSLENCIFPILSFISFAFCDFLFDVTAL